MKPPTILLALGLVTHSLAHMHLTHPSPLNSTNNPHRLTAPDTQLNFPHNCCGPHSHYSLPCRGYLPLVNTPQGAPTAEWQAGSQQSWNIAAGTGGGNHWGGSCQVGFLDFGKEGVEGWAGSGGEEEAVGVRVVRSYEGGCPHRLGGAGPEGQRFNFTVPVDLGLGTNVFAWGWWNREREFNINCAVVNVTIHEGGEARDEKYEWDTSGSSSEFREREIAFASRPLMLLPPDQSKECRPPLTTAELKYPNPGPDVLVGDGVYPLELPQGDC